ncbi:MAG: AMP-binding protein, partial [Alphaproteobacteria bacterium]
MRPGAANYAALSPISFLPRAVEIHPDRIAVVHGRRRITYAEFYARARRLASALALGGVGRGDTVAAMLPNVPAMLEAHFGVPMLGAVLNTINTRLDADTVAYILGHGEARAIITDRAFAAVVGPALKRLKRKLLVIDNDDPLYTGPGERLGEVEYEAFLKRGDPAFAWSPPADESTPIALNYTSGTTGRPKGVVYHHRGAFLESVGNIMAWPLPPRPVYLWTLPLFHCNGWCFPWSVTAMGGTHVCLRAVDPASIFPLIVEHAVTHMCGAPTVLSMLVNAPDDQQRTFSQVVDIQTGGSPPPAKVIKGMEELGFRVTHIYGMTELHGPSTLCEPQEAWAPLPLEERAVQMARQGVRYPVVDGHIVADPKTCKPVPRDGESVGEILVKGNTVMLGYLKDAAATAEAFAGGWMHTGDLAVWYANNYIEIKDRKKDIIISGGENISSVEVEIALYRHAAV